MSVMTDAKLVAIKNALIEKNQKLRNLAELMDVSSWDIIQMDVRNGKASDYPVGTEFESTYTVDGTAYEFPWIVMDNTRECTWSDGTTHPGLWLRSKYLTQEIPVDAPEGETATEATAISGLTYVGITGTTYTNLNLTAGETIPYSSYTTVVKGTVNHRYVYRDGYNRYRDSAIRQWLNSDAETGQWWESTHIGDNPPSNVLNYRTGFIKCLDPSFVSVINPVKIQVAANTSTDGGATDIMYDRFFPLSLEEAYGVVQVANVEGPYFPYWKTATGYDSPTNGSSSSTVDARKIARYDDHSSTAGAHLRSASKNTAYNAWRFNNGYIGDNKASLSLRAMPICVIS